MIVGKEYPESNYGEPEKERRIVIMYKYTIGFIKQGTRLLMLNRNNAPTMGLWNGVGGKLEIGETPLQGIIREAAEETGFELTNFVYKGIVTWEVDAAHKGGMYAFVAELPDGVDDQLPRKVDEGILDWKEIDWLFDDGNKGVSVLIPRYLPMLLNNEQIYEHKCTILNDRLVAYEAIPIESH